MNVVTVMDELGDALDTISGLRVYRYPPDQIHVPAGIVAYPDSIDYNTSYARGMDRITIPLVVVVGKVSDRASALKLGAYLNGSGSTSIKATVDTYMSYTEADSVTVTGAELDVVTVAGVDHVAATFDVDIVGSGT